jgi:hypothetical protein
LNTTLRSRAQRRRGVEHPLTHDKAVWVTSASADGAPYPLPLSFDWDGEALRIATPTDRPTGRNLSATRQVTGARGCSSSEEVRLNWNNWIRQIHRWVSIAFTVAVIVCFVALALTEPAVWVFYTPLPPLALLLLTGLYLFVLPYAARWRSGRRTAREI